VPAAELLRQSVPTAELERYYHCGWAYIMPDFDNPNHSLVEWLSDKMPVYPLSSRKTPTEAVHDHTNNRRQQPA
jgi:hypothetical protein